VGPSRGRPSPLPTISARGCSVSNDYGWPHPYSHAFFHTSFLASTAVVLVEENRVRAFVLHARLRRQNTAVGNRKPNRVIGRDHDIVRRFESLAFRVIHEHRDASVVLRPRPAAAPALARQEPPLPVVLNRLLVWAPSK
jgi:hypothetical protein